MDRLKTYKLFIPIGSFMMLLVIAEAFLRLFNVPDYYFPTPSSIFLEIFFSVKIIIPHLMVTMIEALIGFIGGNLCALIVAVIFSELQIIKLGLYPIMIGLQAVPIIAIAPFINIWFGPTILGKAIMAGLICYFPAVVIATNGFSTTNRDAFYLLESIGATKWQIFYHLRLPSAIPSIVSALQISSTLCTIGAIVAELSGASKGVGYIIVRASYEFRTTMLFATLAVTSIATITLFKFVQFIGDKYGKRFSLSYVVNSNE